MQSNSPVQRPFISAWPKSVWSFMAEGEDIMERRHFLSLVFGVAAGVAVFAATAKAAPLPPISAEQNLVLPRASAEPAVVAQDEVNRLKPEQVRWHHHHWHHHHWHHYR
jgi:hypothetical protein